MAFALGYMFYLKSEVTGNQLGRKINGSDLGEETFPLPHCIEDMK